MTPQEILIYTLLAVLGAILLFMFLPSLFEVLKKL